MANKEDDFILALNNLTALEAATQRIDTCLTKLGQALSEQGASLLKVIRRQLYYDDNTRALATPEQLKTPAATLETYLVAAGLMSVLELVSTNRELK